MSRAAALQTDHERLTLRHLAHAPDLPDIAEDVRAGLSATPKQLPPKYFYDERGSWLFEQICTTPEYYPTRAEEQLLVDYADEIIDRVRPRSILELGSGSSRKTTHLFSACDRLSHRCRYEPLDVCAEILVDAGRRLLARHPWLTVDATVGDYCAGLDALSASPGGPRLILFLGGTIGNFEPQDAAQFLQDIRAVMGPRDRFLLGADRVKDTAVLDAAYNDADGHTAAFNLNVLEVINRELHADFNLDGFRHWAGFNQTASRIEMHLRSVAAQTVRIADLGLAVAFDAGESIRTELSHKFTVSALEALLARAGFAVDRHFSPANDYYSLVLARPV
jgi:L-histidine N-alpha-methyltransferase